MAIWLETKAIESFMSDPRPSSNTLLDRKHVPVPPLDSLHVFFPNSAEESREILTSSGNGPKKGQVGGEFHDPPTASLSRSAGSPATEISSKHPLHNLVVSGGGDRQWRGATLEGPRRQNPLKHDEILFLKDGLDGERIPLLEEEGRRKSSEHHVKELSRHNAQMDAQLQVLKQRCEVAESVLEEQKSLLQSQAAELAIANTFITTADQSSIGDIIRLVEQLNEEIYQAAMNLSDIISSEREGPDIGSGLAEAHGARKMAVDCYGEEVISELVADLSARDPSLTLFEALVQNALVTSCIRLIQSIYPGNPGLNKVLQGIWENISADDPAVGKNWLAMTSSHLEVGIESESTQEAIFCLMIIGGRKLKPFAKDKLHQMALDKLSQVQQKALEVRKMAMEGILSADVEVFCAPSKSSYDSSQMEDTAISQHRPQTDVVVCQTGLGLRYSKTISRTSPQREQTVVLKAKVLLSYACPRLGDEGQI
ncbi:hypothetical protein FA13DRAFT_1786352 [Coprinellus micaceus]|uniref:Uncharacterized protein n=1 Tax=Coprinellus micaceus TaxID=71717 RepID=A0A4Y7TSM2_COPMI|nr:hypothetical protein FA13DRAFT_1786352 [Coprinellus micaceus]